jgi:hypothetical protein
MILEMDFALQFDFKLSCSLLFKDELIDTFKCFTFFILLKHLDIQGKYMQRFLLFIFLSLVITAKDTQKETNQKSIKEKSKLFASKRSLILRLINIYQSSLKKTNYHKILIRKAMQKKSKKKKMLRACRQKKR